MDQARSNQEANQGPNQGQSLLLGAEHQLRQPLNAISLLIGELAQTDSAHERDAILEDLRYALGLSNGWLDALVELEKLSRGMVSPELRTLALDEVFARVKDDFAERFAAQGIAFRVVNSGLSVQADPVLLRRILGALLDNAAKFTREGKVILGGRRRGRFARVEVVDSGLGIPVEDQSRIFRPFYRLENEVRPRERGLGLGLTLAGHMAILCGDSLEVDSKLGRGSRFSLTLKASGKAPGNKPGKGEGAATDLGGAVSSDAAFGDVEMPLNPLQEADVAVFDNADAQAVRDHLQSWGAHVRGGTIDAQGLAESLEDPPVLVIADMADFDAAGGYDQLAAVRQRGAPAPAVVLLSDRGKNDSAAVLPGPVHVLFRPVKPAQLRALCLYALAQR
ncbi:HAMP domain-containing sensor histidine kinase [Pelagibius sp.]|uniref:sensor histidine kinase n=1 Tax=Pelagibius sp. TaxID=1931238 RepID=UPI00260DDE7C|nr:HAMP domain-containing sensor histidine kinase [Pelagibius sp.]